MAYVYVMQPYQLNSRNNMGLLQQSFVRTFTVMFYLWTVRGARSPILHLAFFSRTQMTSLFCDPECNLVSPLRVVIRDSFS